MRTGTSSAVLFFGCALCWEYLPAFKLHALEDLANRQAARFKEAADALDVELFGPIE